MDLAVFRGIWNVTVSVTDYVIVMVTYRRGQGKSLLTRVWRQGGCWFRLPADGGGLGKAGLAERDFLRGGSWLKMREWAEETREYLIEML